MVTHFSLALALVFALLSPHLAAQEHDGELFEKSIRPILVERCVACHNPAVLEGGGARQDCEMRIYHHATRR